jgi:hypothetical protein
MTLNLSIRNSERIHRLSQTFGLAPDDVVSKLLDNFLFGNDVHAVEDVAKKQPNRLSSGNPSEAGQGNFVFSRDRSLNLKHTRVLFAEFGGEQPVKMTWNSLMDLALEKLWSVSSSFDEFAKLAGANLVEGVRESNGYHPVLRGKFSVQGRSAPDAAQVIHRAAKALGVKAEVDFAWHEKPEAAHPGEQGRLQLG